MSRVREYTPGDEEKIVPHEAFTFTPIPKEAIRKAHAGGSAVLWTILSPKGSPLGIVGGYFPLPKVMDVWSLSDATILLYPKRYASTLRAVIAHWFQAADLDRMQFTVRKDQPWACRWAKFLGFQMEGILRKYENGCDCYLFARLKDGSV